jgi:Nuclear pore assembly and biogenesis
MLSTTNLLATFHNLTSKLHDLSLQITSKTAASPSLTTIALLLIILFLSLKVLDMLYRSILFWLRFMFRAVVLVGLIGLGGWFYVRGVDGVAEDAQALSTHWVNEYERYSALGRGAGDIWQGAGTKIR